MKRYLLPVFFLFLTGCKSLHNVQIVEHAKHDTLYINTLQHDSVYMKNDHIEEYRPSLVPSAPFLTRVDTLIIHDKEREYRYRFLRDTTRIVKIDSIPVVHEVEVVKHERYIPAAYKWALGICIMAIVIVIMIIVIRIIR